MNDTPGLPPGLGRAARGAVPVTEPLWHGGTMGSSPTDGRDTGRCPGGATNLLAHPKATEKAPHSPGAHQSTARGWGSMRTEGFGNGQFQGK